MLLAGIVLRIAAVSRSAVEHFDEGVYASNIFFPPPEYAYPMQRFFAPPLVPALIEASWRRGCSLACPRISRPSCPAWLPAGPQSRALWWFGRSWFGPRAGLAVATLCALSPFHIAYSATALTDILLGLWLVLAVDAAARSLFQRDLRWAIGAGLYTGLAWWTKYNGWLPLAIEAAGIVVLWGWGLGTRGSGLGPLKAEVSGRKSDRECSSRRAAR